MSALAQIQSIRRRKIKHDINCGNRHLTLHQTTKFLDQSNLKAFADDILISVQLMIHVTDWVVNIVGKGENAGNLFSQCFLG